MQDSNRANFERFPIANTWFYDAYNRWVHDGRRAVLPWVTEIADCPAAKEVNCAEIPYEPTCSSIFIVLS